MSRVAARTAILFLLEGYQAGVGPLDNILGSPQEFVRVAILRGFHDSVDDDEFEVGRGQPFGFQQEVSQVLVAAAAVDQ